MGSYCVGRATSGSGGRLDQVFFSFQRFAMRWQTNEQPLKVFVKKFDRLSGEIGTVRKLIMKFNDYLLLTSR
jgi:hypothetical protein